MIYVYFPNIKMDITKHFRITMSKTPHCMMLYFGIKCITITKLRNSYILMGTGVSSQNLMLKSEACSKASGGINVLRT